MARIKHIPVSNHADGAPGTRDKPVAPVPVTVAVTPRRRRGRTNSERGRAYRKRKELETERLEAQVAALRAAVQEKQFLLGVWEAKYLRSRHSLDGSRVAIVREYHALFRRGLRAADARQDALVHGMMDRDVDVGWQGMRGPQAVLEQWRLHTSAFARYSGELVGDPVVVGSDECPLVQVRIDVHALIGEATLNGLFSAPARAAAHRLLYKCMNTLVRFSCRSSFQFTREGRVGVLLVHIDYAAGFVAAGMELSEVAELLKLSALTPLSTIALGSASGRGRK